MTVYTWLCVQGNRRHRHCAPVLHLHRVVVLVGGCWGAVKGDNMLWVCMCFSAQQGPACGYVCACL